MRTECLKSRPGIALGARGDVAALGIQDDRDHRAQAVRSLPYCLDDLLQHSPSLGSIGFKEGSIGLEGGCIGCGRFHEPQAERPGCIRGGRRQVGRVRVQAHT